MPALLQHNYLCYSPLTFAEATLQAGDAQPLFAALHHHHHRHMAGFFLHPPSGATFVQPRPTCFFPRIRWMDAREFASMIEIPPVSVQRRVGRHYCVFVVSALTWIKSWLRVIRLPSGELFACYYPLSLCWHCAFVFAAAIASYATCRPGCARWKRAGRSKAKNVCEFDSSEIYLMANIYDEIGSARYDLAGCCFLRINFLLFVCPPVRPTDR